MKFIKRIPRLAMACVLVFAAIAVTRLTLSHVLPAAGWEPSSTVQAAILCLVVAGGGVSLFLATYKSTPERS
jgi:hypothetical protein